jgi:transcriptional regulator with XRE-family HTH domain
VLSELLDLRGLSNRELGKRLASPKGTEKQAENQRIQVIEWRKGKRRGGTDPSNESLERLAEILELPAYLLILLYRHDDERQMLLQRTRDLARAQGLVLPEP